MKEAKFSAKAICVGIDDLSICELERRGILVKCRISKRSNSKFTFNGLSISIKDFSEYKINKHGFSIDHETFKIIRKRLVDAGFLRCLSRYPADSANIFSWQDIDLLILKNVSYSMALIMELGVDTLIFSSVPHRTATLTLFEVGKHLGLKLVLCNQSQFPGKMWITNDFRDIGRFESSIEQEEVHIDISRPECQPFYMSNLKNSNAALIKVIRSYAKASIIVSSQIIFSFFLGRRTGLIKSIDYLRSSFARAIFRKIRVKRRFISLTNIDNPFVYFPLHLQPEMTTDVLGGEYANQVTTILKLKELIPEENLILIKENPKQTGAYRSKLFYDTIYELKNVYWVSDDTSTFDLIEKAACVATITGTVGWEALRFGKPVICFGSVFYNQLPGVFRVGTNFQWDDLLQFTFDKIALTAAVKKMSRYLSPGVSNFEYRNIVEEFNPQKNAFEVSDSIVKYIHHLKSNSFKGGV